MDQAGEPTHFEIVVISSTSREVLDEYLSFVEHGVKLFNNGYLSTPVNIDSLERDFIKYAVKVYEEEEAEEEAQSKVENFIQVRRARRKN